MDLFDDILSTSPKRGRFNSGWYSWLVSSDQPEMVRRREILDRWFESYPADDKVNLQRRFQSDDDDQHLSALFELYCHALLEAQGYTVESHPMVDSTIPTRVDFVARRDGRERLVLECTAVANSHQKTGEQGRLNMVLDDIDRTASNGFLLGVKVRRIGASVPRTRSLRNYLRQWLANLDPDALIQQRCLDKATEIPTREWTCDD